MKMSTTIRTGRTAGLADATLTQEVSLGATLTLGLVYANKPEYRVDVDKEFSARFGVNYKISQSD